MLFLQSRGLRLLLRNGGGRLLKRRRRLRLLGRQARRRDHSRWHGGCSHHARHTKRGGPARYKARGEHRRQTGWHHPSRGHPWRKAHRPHWRHPHPHTGAHGRSLAGVKVRFILFVIALHIFSVFPSPIVLLASGRRIVCQISATYIAVLQSKGGTEERG
jgi:hypothetical protein